MASATHPSIRRFYVSLTRAFRADGPAGRRTFGLRAGTDGRLGPSVVLPAHAAEDGHERRTAAFRSTNTSPPRRRASRASTRRTKAPSTPPTSPLRPSRCSVTRRSPLRSSSTWTRAARATSRRTTSSPPRKRASRAWTRTATASSRRTNSPRPATALAPSSPAPMRLRRTRESQQKRAEFKQKYFDRIDANHDGVITQDEYIAAATAHFNKVDATARGESRHSRSRRRRARSNANSVSPPAK